MSESESVKGLVNTVYSIVPYVGIDRIIDVLSAMHKRNVKEIELADLASILGCTRSNLNNVTPVIGALGLGTVKNSMLILSSDGLEFSDFCVTDSGRAKQIIRKDISSSEALMFTKSLLEKRSSISGEEIGRALAEKFRKKWKDLRTYRTFGNSCASILSYAGFGYFYDGLLSLKPPTVKIVSNYIPPALGYNSIVKLLASLHGFERAKAEDIANKLGLTRGVIYGYLSVCTVLKLIEKETANTYRLTEFGKQLIDPTIPPEDKSLLFKKCLLSSQYRSLVEKLAQYGKELTFEEIGDIISFFMEGSWSQETKKSYAKKLVTWLNNSGLIVKKKAGFYKVILDADPEIDNPNDSMLSAQLPVDVDSVFEVGRSIGNLEGVTVEDKLSYFNDQIILLKKLVNNKNIDLALDLLAKNFEVSQSSVDQSIYKANLDFIREKIKEKVITGESE